MTVDDKDATLTADELVAASPAQPPSHHPAALLRFRDPDRYEILGEHGRGGLGAVSRAHDKELGRDVAIKELLSRDGLGEVRFLREALITARLEHPGIVPIHEAGRWPDGTPFYVMKLVAGRSLKELIAARRTVKDRLELLHHVIAVADAVAYAHKRKIIHRDLKPSNVIAGDFGETIVIDWGLAKDLTASDEPSSGGSSRRAVTLEDLTSTGEVLGTPMYMPPEQRRGEVVDQRADVFAIGAMLWQLCSLERVPLPDPEERDRWLRRANIDPDLAAIITKALAPDPRDRYQDAGELADDLRAFKSGARIAARHYSILGMVAHWTRRHRLLAASVGFAIVLAIVGSAVFVTNIAAERDRADAALATAEELQQRAERVNDRLVLQNAELLLRRDPTAAVTALSEYRGRDDVRRNMLLAEAEGRGVAAAVFTPHGDTIWFLAGDADGAVYSLAEDRRVRVTKAGTSTTLAADVSTSGIHDYSAAGGLLAYARAPAGISVLDLKTRRVTSIDAGTPAEMALAPDGSRLAVLDSRGGLTVWDLSPVPAVVKQVPLHGVTVVFAGPSRLIVRERAAIRAISLGSQQPGDVTAALPPSSLHARNDDVIIGDASGHITLLSPALTPIAKLAVCHKQVNGVRLAARAKLVAFACQDGLAGLASYDELRGVMSVVGTFQTHAPAFRAEPDASGTRVVVRADSNVVYLYDAGSRLVTRYEGHGGRVSFIAAPSPVYERVLVGDVNGAVRVWEPSPPNARVVLQATKAVYGAVFSPDHKLIVTYGADGIVRRIGLDDGAVTELRGHANIVGRVRFSPDGQSFLSISNDGTIRVWSLTGEEPVRVFSNHASIIGDAEYTEGGRRIVSVGDDGRLLSWSPQGNDGSVLFTHSSPLSALEVLARSGHVVVHDSSGAVWDISPGGVSRQIREADGDVITMLRASADGSLLAVGMRTGTVTLYETDTYKAVSRTVMAAGIRQINFDPQNRDLLISSEEGHVRFVSLDSRRTAPWRDLMVAARDVTYSRDGETIAFVCGDGGAWFYALRASSWVYTRDHGTDVLSGRFSQDGARFASTDRSGIVVVRDVARTFAARNK